MLLEFRTKNYKSFVEELIFSMEPAPKQKGLDYSITKEKIGRKTYKALSSAVIYGPNASGKSNLIGAMDTFSSIVLRGNIRNGEIFDDPNTASSALELIPNISLQKPVPVEFSIKFIAEGLLVEYAFSADLGVFLDKTHPRKIISESLKINDFTIFLRNETLNISNLNVIRNFLINAFEENEKNAINLAKSNLVDDEFFLMNGFKTMFSTKLVGIIRNWLEDNLMIIYKADSRQLVLLNNQKKNSVFIENNINTAAKQFGITGNDLGYVVDAENNSSNLASIFDEAHKNLLLPAEIFESYGTIRFVNIFPLVISALVQGNVLIVDEFDASIHPMAIINIINIFHNDELNKHRAQLIFNTHNPIFLNSNLFRRDEIKFIDRDEETHQSTHYSLSDFGTSGKSGVRKNEDYFKNYFVDRYGAIKDIDFSTLIKDIVDREER